MVCINDINEELPPHVAYISSRNKAEDVYINIDPGFLVCCDCTDNCQVNYDFCFLKTKSFNASILLLFLALFLVSCSRCC